jgi:hypothetical protein
LWGYSSSQFSTETTCLALLALGDVVGRKAFADYIRGLMSRQRETGFWPAVDLGGADSIWATAIGANTLNNLLPRADAVRRALRALLTAEPQEAFWLWRLKFRTTDNHVQFDPNKYGWGWVPGTFSWVIPTAMAVIALERSCRLKLVQSDELKRRVDLGRAMLLDRMCPGGGWNAGNSIVYGVALASHIDATAIALAALRFHYHLLEVRRSLSWLLAADCSSAYSLAWKILALLGYTDIRTDVQPAIERARAKLTALVQEPAQVADTSTLALSILALNASPNPFTLEGPQ